jgi:hypothetical protein
LSFCINLSYLHYMYASVYLYEKTCFCWLTEVLSPQKGLGLKIEKSTKYKSGNKKKRLGYQTKNLHSATHICGRSPNLTNYFSPQISGCVICGTYLRTVTFVSYKELLQQNPKRHSQNLIKVRRPWQAHKNINPYPDGLVANMTSKTQH